MKAHNEEWLVEEDEAGVRVDKFIASSLEDLSRVFIQSCIKDGLVQRNGKVAKPSDKVLENDHISFDIPEIEEFVLEAEDFDLPILFEDDHILVINKPAGIIVHPGAGNPTGTIVNQLLGYKPEVFNALIDEENRPGIVHRLDKETSGVMVIAKSEVARDKLKAGFKGRSIKKTYLALVRGRMKQEKATIDTWYGRDPNDRLKMAVLPEPGKEAITHYKSIARHNAVSVLKVRIETGRTHQIRVHMAYLGNPIVGDKTYCADAKLEEAEGHNRQLLHAWKLSFYHPVTEEDLVFMADVPQELIDYAAKSNIMLTQ